MNATIPAEDRVYYERRLAEEMARAAAATIPEIAAAHQTMATSYAAKLNGTESAGEA